jgi:hypothetical protein
MQRLQIRAYRPASEGNSWSLIGVADKPEKVRRWLDDCSWQGLILHTGFSVLERGTVLDLLPSAREGLVFCAATKAILPEMLPDDRINVCRGLADDGAAPLENINGWFFCIPKSNQYATPDSDEDVSSWRLTCLTSMENRKKHPLSYVGESTDLTRALIDHPDALSTLISSGICTVEDFRSSWKTLPEWLYLDTASVLVQQSQAPYLDLIQDSRESNKDDWVRQCEAIVAISPHVPDWDKEIPPTPVRPYNALRAQGVTDLHGLSSMAPLDILKVPNLGKKAMVSLFDYLIRYKVFTVSGMPLSPEKSEISLPGAEMQTAPSYTLESSPSVGEAIDSILSDLERTYPSRKNKRGVRILARRFSGETLESIGEDGEVTRERIRQIAEVELKRVKGKLDRAESQGFINFRSLISLISGLMERATCSQIEFDNLVRVFSESDLFEPGAPQRRHLEKLFEGAGVRFIALKLASTDVALPVPKDLPEEVEESLDRTLNEYLEPITGMTVKEAQEYIKSELLDKVSSPFIASALAIETVIYRASIDDNGVVAPTGSRIRSHQAVEAIVHLLKEAGRPLHGISEIYPAMPEIYQDSVSERRISSNIEEHQSRCPSDNADYIFGMGRGSYGLWEHTGITESQGSLCADYIEEYLNKSPNRQFSDHELYQALSKEGMANWEADHVDRARYVSMILTRYRPSKVRYLGRFVWQAGAWTDERDTSGRHQIHDLIADFIKEKNRPVTKQQIDEHVSALRGRGVGDQYHEHHGLVRLSGSGKNTLYWHESLDPEDFDSESVKALAAEIVGILQHTSGLFMSGLKADITKHSDVAANYNPMQFLALLLRMPEVKVKQNSQNQILVYATGGER